MPTTPSSSPAIRTLLLCDLVGSTGILERVGDAAAAELLARHDRCARDLLSTLQGREIDKSDGFLLLFERPIEAVRFALAYRARLRELGAEFDVPLRARVGIHLGEVVMRENPPEDVARGAKPLEVEGLAKAIAARVTSLAGDGRILLTRAAYDFARRGSVGAGDGAPLRWAVHGSYRLAGVEEPIEVCEVAEPGEAPLAPPASAEKAERADAEPVLAVLAFDNLSSDPEMQFFSDGVSEEIIQRVSRGARLKVIGRTSSFQFRGEQKSEAAASLGCSHVLDGSIRRAAGRVRISAHLVETASRTTLWSDRYDRGLEDIFAVQDEISESIAGALHHAFSGAPTRSVDPDVYDLYLRASPRSFAPEELRANVGHLEVVTRRAPGFAAAWGRLAYQRAFLHFYAPYAERAPTVDLVVREAESALALDSQNVDALAGKLFVVRPFGAFVEADALVDRMRAAPGSGDGKKYIAYFLRAVGRVRESAEEAERVYRLNALDLTSANMAALAWMAAGQLEAAAPLYEELVEREPDMAFPVSSLLRVYAFQEDWAAVDRLLELAERRQLREFRDGLPFIRTKRDPTPENIGAMRDALQAHAAKTGSVDATRLVYAAHLGLVDEAYRAAGTARLGPTGGPEDVMGPDAYRTSMLFQAGMPELRDDARFPRLCARLGLVEYWSGTGRWPDCADEVPYDFRAECAKARAVPKEDFGFYPA